jgi:[ribosomal protein S5]-alanine N-acetyltransferase
MIIKTKRLTLRPLALSDAEALLEAFGDEETMRYWAHGPVTSLEEMQRRVARFVTVEGLPDAFAVAERDGGPAIGRVSLYDFRYGGAEAGYVFSRKVWGKGYAREALGALLDYAFGERRLHRIALDIDPENTASIRLAQRMGFRWEGHFKEYFLRECVYLDSVFYAMLAREWRDLKGSA